MESLEFYLKEIRKIDLLKPEEEIKLAELVQKGNQEAKNKMIEANLRLVIMIAKRYMNLGLSLEDLIEEGNIGLITGVDKFDPTRGFRFSTYVSWWIRQGVTKAIIDKGKMIRIPVYMNDEIHLYKKSVQKLRQKLDREPLLEEISKETKFSYEKIKKLESHITNMSSLDVSFSKQDESRDIKETMDAKKIFDTQSELEQVFQSEFIHKMISILSKRENFIIKKRYGMEDGHYSTLEEVSKDLHLSRERIRQIENSAIKKIKKYYDNVLSQEQRGIIRKETQMNMEKEDKKENE